MTIEQVKQFVMQAMFLVRFINMQSRCIDGRPKGDGTAYSRLPAVSKPGADIGDLMIVVGVINNLGLRLPMSEALNMVATTYGGIENLKFHTDFKAEEQNLGCGRGCGHINKAFENPEAYDLNPEQMGYIINELPVLEANGAKQVVLEGEHNEKGILIINSEHYGVKPYVGDLQFFIYHKTLHDHQLDQLVKPFHKKVRSLGSDIHIGELRTKMDEVFGKQLEATRKKIAADLPIFDIGIDAVGAVKAKLVQN